MNSKYARLFKNTGILAISNFSSKILVFFLVPLYTSILSTEEYGVYDLLVSTIELLFPILTVNIVDSVMRFSMEKDAKHTKIFSNAIRLVVFGVFFVGILLFLNRILNLFDDIYGLEHLVLLYYFFYVTNQLLIQFAKGLEKIKELGVSGVVSVIVTILANILFLIVFQWGFVGFFVASILGFASAVVYLSITLKVWKYIDISFDNALLKQMIAYSLPLMFSVIGWWVNSSANKYIVAFVCGAAANGILSVALKLPTILSTLQNIFIQAWQVSAIKEYNNEKTNAFYAETFVLLNALMCIGCSGLILLTRPLASFLFTNDFYQAWKYVPYLLISAVFNAAAGYVGPILAAKKDSKAMMRSAFYGAGVNIICNIALVQFIGVQGAAISMLLAGYVSYLVRKKAAGQLVVSKDYKLVMISWIGLVLQATAEIWVSSYVVSIIFVLLMLCIYHKYIRLIVDSILSLYKKLFKV